jgi:SAM-dependent methyltransferase
MLYLRFKMKKNYVPGTKGYAEITEKFIEANIAVDFHKLQRDFVPFFPGKASRILDIGAGIGRDASVFCSMGHAVIAVEPTLELRMAGKQLYNASNLEWIDDSLPDLGLLDKQIHRFDFVLASGIWHHLDPQEQQHSIVRIASLLNSEGIFALTLQHGPAGAGTHVFPTDAKQTIQDAQHCGLTNLLCLENEPSLLPGKAQVTWTKLVLQKK